MDLDSIPESITWVRVVFVDNGNMIRTKAIYRTSLGDFEGGIGCTSAHPGMVSFIDETAPDAGVGSIGDMRLIPDWKSFRTLPYAPGHACVMGNFMLQERPHPHCTRTFLKRVLDSAREMGFELKVGVEEEFILLNKDGSEIDMSTYLDFYAIDVVRPFVDDLTACIVKQGMQPMMYHAESGHGQHEITYKYDDPMTTADNHIRFRCTAHALAHKHNMRVSFMPKRKQKDAGSGLHVHFSLWKDGKNVFPDANEKHGISTVGKQFMAGILNHLSSLSAVTLASRNSYARVAKSSWAGAFQIWGVNNREAALRVPSNGNHPPSDVELKTCDHTANPYLAIGCAIAAGLDGIKNQMVLPEPVQFDPAKLDDNQLKQSDIKELPHSLEEALKSFEANSVFKEAMGVELHQSYRAVKRFECEYFKNKPTSQVVDELEDIF